MLRCRVRSESFNWNLNAFWTFLEKGKHRIFITNFCSLFEVSCLEREHGKHSQNNHRYRAVHGFKSLPRGILNWIEVRINWKSEKQYRSKSKKEKKKNPAANSLKKFFHSRKTIRFFLTFALFTGIQLEFMLDCSLKLPSNVSAISCLMLLL